MHSVFYVSGREFTVLISENSKQPTEPFIYQPFECVLSSPEDFKHFDRKFVNFDNLKWAEVVNEEKLTADLKAITRKIYEACGGNFFARFVKLAYFGKY